MWRLKSPVPKSQMQRDPDAKPKSGFGPFLATRRRRGKPEKLPQRQSYDPNARPMNKPMYFRKEK